jgi:hypothetical protein
MARRFAGAFELVVAKGGDVELIARRDALREATARMRELQEGLFEAMV